MDEEISLDLEEELLQNRKKLLAYMQIIAPAEAEDVKNFLNFGLIPQGWLDALIEVVSDMDEKNCLHLYQWTQSMEPVGTAETRNFGELQIILAEKVPLKKIADKKTARTITPNQKVKNTPKKKGEKKSKSAEKIAHLEGPAQAEKKLTLAATEAAAKTAMSASQEARKNEVEVPQQPKVIADEKKESVILLLPAPDEKQLLLEMNSAQTDIAERKEKKRKPQTPSPWRAARHTQTEQQKKPSDREVLLSEFPKKMLARAVESAKKPDRTTLHLEDLNRELTNSFANHSAVHHPDINRLFLRDAEGGTVASYDTTSLKIIEQ